jgi:hypothetical protein
MDSAGWLAILIGSLVILTISYAEGALAGMDNTCNTLCETKGYEAGSFESEWKGCGCYNTSVIKHNYEYLP